MTGQAPRKVTRAYARGLIGAVVILAIAIVVASWGTLALLLERDPIYTTVPAFTAPLIILACIAVTIWLLWREIVHLLRGNRASWLLIVVLPGLVYLIWCLIGTAVGFEIEETWLSPFSVALAVAFLIGLLGFWFVILRKLYTDRGRPQWPWEKKELDEGPDWYKDGLP